MIALSLALACLVHAPCVAADTITIQLAPSAPVVDGRIGSHEYGSPAARIATAAGEVRVWLASHGEFVYIAAEMPDSSFYWGDDFVISLDANGSADASPQSGDRQWYLRRMLDSSVVSNATDGRWSAPGQQQSMLGPMRRDADWDVASSSTSSGWTVELRLRATVLAGSAAPRIAFRTYNDNPHGWWSWPSPPAGTPPQRVERSPSLWIPVVLAR